MKYISRLTALLLAAMMIVTSAGAELTTSELTLAQMEAMYTAVSNDIETMLVTDVLGAAGWFSSDEAAAWAAQGYTLQWYTVNEAGERTEIEGQTTSKLDVSYTMEGQRYICIATDEDNSLKYETPVYIVVADTEDMDGYIGALYSEYCYLYDWLLGEEPDTTIDAYLAAAYNWMITWNVALSDGSNLAENVLAAWLADPYPSDLLCNCAGEDAGFCILAPDAEHDVSCGWYTGSPVLDLTEETDENGKAYYVLSLLNAEGESQIIAVTEMLDGVHHYFKDVQSNLFVAYLQIADDGAKWIVPLESEKELNGKDPAN